jgi:DNA-binding response OmpR family regulator
VDEKASRSATILLVEDDPLILKLVATTLIGRGHTMLTATTPDEAIRMAEDRSGVIDLLLTDVIMPGMNGIALAEQLKVSRPHLKCLFMSGYTANFIETQVMLQDGAPFIAKPFHLKDLSAKVKEVLYS